LQTVQHASIQTLLSRRIFGPSIATPIGGGAWTHVRPN
jgi:hypothetical protein